MHLTENFSPQSKVWIYQSSRPFTMEETISLNKRLAQFAQQWTAHDAQLMATGFVKDNRILILMVDETHTGASGCSIDTSVRFIKGIETDLQIQLFDRTIVNYYLNNEIFSTTISGLSELLKTGVITPETAVFDPLVTNKYELDHGAIKSLNASWISNLI